MEAVCVCAHAWDEHDGALGACSRCVSPPCAFFWLHFWREEWSLPQQREEDPVGHYWRLFGPDCSTASVFARMSLEDRQEIASDCFRTGSFASDGEMNCNHRPDCQEEYLCEVLAAHILMPERVFAQDFLSQSARMGHVPTVIQWLATTYEVPDWAVRFRLAMEMSKENHD